MSFTKEQIENLKDAVRKYERWLVNHEASAKTGQGLLDMVKTCSGATGQNWATVQVDVDKALANYFKTLD